MVRTSNTPLSRSHGFPLDSIRPTPGLRRVFFVFFLTIVMGINCEDGSRKVVRNKSTKNFLFWQKLLTIGSGGAKIGRGGRVIVPLSLIVHIRKFGHKIRVSFRSTHVFSPNRCNLLTSAYHFNRHYVERSASCRPSSGGMSSHQRR